MILVLEEVDLPDGVCEAENYDPWRVSIDQFQVDESLIERARLVTFRFHGENSHVYVDLKNRDGSVSSYFNDHPRL